MKQLIHQEKIQEKLVANIIRKEMREREFEERYRRVLQNNRMARLDRSNRALPMKQKVEGIPQFQFPNMPRLCFALIKDFVEGDTRYIKERKEAIAKMNDNMEAWNQEMMEIYHYYDANNPDDTCSNDTCYYKLNEYDHYENGQLILSRDNIQRIDEQHQGVIEVNESDYYVKEKPKSHRTYKDQKHYHEKKRFTMNQLKL